MNDAVKLESYRKNLTYCLLLILLGLEEVRRLLGTLFGRGTWVTGGEAGRWGGNVTLPTPCGRARDLKEQLYRCSSEINKGHTSNRAL